MILAPREKNQINFPHNQINFIHTEIKWNLITLTEIKSIWTTRTRKQVNFRAHNKNKWLSASMQVTSQFLPPTQQPNRVHPYPEIKSSLIPHTEIKPISTTISKSESNPMLTLKTSNVPPAHKNKVNFDPRTKNISFSILILKPSQFISPHKTKFGPQHWNQGNFDPHTINKSFLHTPTRTPSSVRSRLNTSYFRPPHQTKSVMIPTLKLGQLRSPILK